MCMGSIPLDQLLREHPMPECYALFARLRPLPFLTRFRFMSPIEKALAKVFPWLSFSNIAVIRKSDTGLEKSWHDRILEMLDAVC